MRRAVSKSESGWMRWLLPVFFGAAMGLMATSLVLTGFSLLLILQDIPQSIIQPLAIGAFSIGALLSGYLAACIVGKRGLLMGVLSGLLCCLVLQGASFAIADGVIDVAQGIQLALALICSATGGVMGVNRKNRRKA